MTDPYSTTQAPPPAGVALLSHTFRRGLRFLWRRSWRARCQAESLFGRFHCNVCDHRVFHFLPLSTAHPETAANMKRYGFNHEFETFNQVEYACPFCGATERDRMYAVFMDELLARDQGREAIRIVDFAPVRCLSACVRRKLQGRPGTYRTADLFNPEVDDQVDLMDMRLYRDGQFDFFICSHILEHVTDDQKAMRELFRVLRPGGSGIVMVPVALDIQQVDEDPAVTDEAERWRRFGQHDHVRLYSKSGLLERLRRAGFTVAELGMAHFGAETFAKLAVPPGSILYIVSRPV